MDEFDYLLFLIDNELVKLESEEYNIEILQEVFIERIAPYIKIFINNKNASSI